MKSYLPWLQVRQKWLKSARNFRKGDLVLVMDGELDGRWSFPKALVEETYPDDQGLVRNVLIRMASGQTYRRDIRKLTLLEVVDEEEGKDREEDEEKKED